jgi:uncharacterized membrane protein YidH (DUF202 family)
MDRMKPGAEYVKGYSMALLGLGFFFLVGALQFKSILHGAEAAPTFAFLSSFLCLLGIACLAVSLLRWMRVAAAVPATTALSFCLLIAFPFGTALSLYWLARVRPKELTPQETSSQRAWFNYTVALYVMSLLFLDAALVFHFMLGDASSTAYRPVELLALVMLVLALAAIVVGTLRSTSLRRGHWATLIFNVFLFLWFPLGTVLALVWFFVVRKHEKSLLSEESR